MNKQQLAKAFSRLAEEQATPMHEAIPRILPAGWTILQRFGDGNAYRYRNGLKVLVSTAPFEDGREWMHISLSRNDRIPNYDDVKFVKNTFAEGRFAYQIFPPLSQNINIHEFCLHLWVPLTGELPLPNFGARGSI